MYSTYLIAYYAAGCLALIGASGVLLLRDRTAELRGVTTLLILVVGATYLIGMLRQDGVDFGVYSAAFYEDPGLIPDPGFRMLMISLNAVGLPIQVMMLLVSAVTLLSLHRAARYFGISFLLLLVVYFLHLAIIRDFAQFRVGFAVGLAILGATSDRKWKKGGFYLLAVSMHLTSAAFVLTYEFCRRVAEIRSRRVVWLMMAVAVAGIFIIGGFVQYLTFLDPRIQVYLEWDKAGYGMPVGQFLILFFQLFILTLAYEARKGWEDDARIRALFLQQTLGVAAFIAFAGVAILAFRISSVVLSFYPILLIAALMRLRVRVNTYSMSRLAALSIFFAIGCVLLARPGSMEVLQLVRFQQ